MIEHLEDRPEIHPVDRWIGPGGALAGVFPGYEAREAQLEFARDVSMTFERGGVLLAEAPTGVGKSLGYLIPALLWARQQREPVVVSTYTKALQGQLTDVDLALVARLDNDAPRVVRLKGKSNYICPRRWKLHLAEAKKKGAKPSVGDRAVGDWLELSNSGDLDEVDFGSLPGGTALRSRIACEASFCHAGACRPNGDCAWRRARREAASADIVVVNHALLVTGSLAQNVLPPFRGLIVDEAHHLDAVFTAQSTVRQSLGRLETVLALAVGDRPGQGSLSTVVQLGARGRVEPDAERSLSLAFHALEALAPEIRDAGRAFYGSVAHGLAQAPVAGDGYEPRGRYRNTEDLVTHAPDSLDRLLELGYKGEREWRRIADLLTEGRRADARDLDDLAADVAGALGQWQGWLSELRFATDPKDGEFVFWRSGGKPENSEVAAAPVDVARRVRELLMPELHAMVLTSATLASGGSFRYVRERLGLAEDSPLEVRERVYPSPFDLPRQLGAWVLDAAEDRAAGAIETLHRKLGRNTLALFTSHRALRRAARALKDALGDDAEVWAQDVDGTAIELARRFRESRGALLLGTASFWEGVDFPGEALEVLVVTRLPFSVPNDPLVEARCERVEKEGESAFARVMVPEAVLRFRQGIGRLVRRKTDRGVLTVLDARFAQRGYGQAFLKSLPTTPRIAASATELAEQAAAFLSHPMERA